MAFVAPDLAESVAMSGAQDSDGTKTTEANLNDDDTGSTATNEIRAGMTVYKITHDLGFPVANLDTLSIRYFDGVIMTADFTAIYPYSSGDTDVVTGNEEFGFVTDNAAYDEVNLDAMVGDFGDVGTNQISIRIAWIDPLGALRGRFNNIQIDFSEAAGGVEEVPLIMAQYQPG